MIVGDPPDPGVHGWFVRVRVNPPSRTHGYKEYKGCCSCGYETSWTAYEPNAAQTAQSHVRKAEGRQ